MHALKHTSWGLGTPGTSPVWPRFRRHFATLLVVSIATLFVAAACGSDEAVMFDEEGEPMAEEEASVIKTAAVKHSADTASDFQIVLFQNSLHKAGENLRLSDLKGNPVVVNFWFPSCPPCRAEMPDLEKVFQNHRKDGVEFVGVQLLGLDSKEDGQEFVDEIGVNFAIGPDENGSIFQDYGVRGFPSTVFLDSDLKIVRTWTGPLNEEKLEEFVQELLP